MTTTSFPLRESFPISLELRRLIDAVRFVGSSPIIVGGSVRDWVLGLDPKDIDIECYGQPLEVLEKGLVEAGLKVDAVGRSFGVLKVTVTISSTRCRVCAEPAESNDVIGGGADFFSCGHPQGVTFDVSLPRSDNKVGEGHRGFVTTTDHNMSFRDASARRDFTINAMGLDPCHPKAEALGMPILLDPHGGMQDIKAGVLRHVSAAFDEDPLRVLRGCQFASRFGFTLAPDTIERCRNLKDELATLPVERLWEEWKKLLLKGKKPSLGLQALVETGAIDLFPEVKALIGVAQDPEWHPEGQDDPLGSLWVHNCMVTDQAVRVCDDDGLEGEERLAVMLGAFCHDLGKPAVTRFEAKSNDPDGEKRWRAHAHEEAGVEPTRSFLTRIGAPPGVIEAVIPLVAHHLKPFHLARDKASPSSIRRLALKAPLDRLTRVARADFLGRTTPDALACTDSREIEDIKWLMDKAKELQVADRAPQGILMGRHLIDLGMKPGKEMGQMVKAAFEAQMDGVFADEAGAIAWAKERLGGTTA